MPSSKDLIGKPAPKLTLPSATEESYTLDPASTPKPVILFFFPKAQTPGCTKEACSFRDALASKPLYSGSPGDDSGVQIIGISPDPPAKQKAFVEQHKLTYPVLCDVDGEATKAYNVSRGLLGLSPGRTTFIIDNGTIVDVYDSVLNVNAHENFVTKWLEKRAAVKSVAPGEEPSKSTVEEPSTTSAE